MKAYQTYFYQPLLTSATNHLGTFTSTSSGLTNYRRLAVTGGETQGDFHSPTPIRFFKRLSTRVQGRTISRGMKANQASYSLSETGMIFGGEGFSYNVVRPEILSVYPILEEEAQMDIYGQLRDGPNLVVDAAEWKQTRNLITDAGNVSKRFATFADTVVANQRNKKWRQFDYVANRWLEWRYGVMPVVYSIYDSLDVLGKKLSIEPLIISARARRGGIVTSKTFPVPATYTGFKRLESQGSARLELKYRFIPPNMLDLHDWTSLSPAVIAWELFPLSFVYDWLVNVGDILSLWENYFQFRASFVDGRKTFTVRDNITYEENYTFRKPVSYWPNGQAIDGTYYINNVTTSVGRISHKDRMKVLTLSMPPGINPRFRVKLNASRYTDAIAIFGKKLSIVERLLTNPWTPKKRIFM